jgi:hypothetical protein
MDLLSTWTPLTWTQRSNLELDTMGTIFWQYGGRSVRLGADNVVTLPLAGVTPSQDNTEQGNDTESTSDICYMASDTRGDAGDNPDDTLSANEEGSYVRQ